MLVYWRAESGVSEDFPEKRISAEKLLGETIPTGTRNESLFRIACYLRRSHSVAAMEAILNAINLTQCNPPLDRSDIRTICRSAARFPGKPSRHQVLEVEV